MKLTLATKTKKPYSIGNNITKIGNKDLVIINQETGEELEEKVGMLWGSRELITKEVQLLTDEYVIDDPEDAGYLVIVIRCDEAINL